MSDAIRELHDYLAKSPSVIYPEDALAYLPAIEAENAKLREFAAEAWELLTCNEPNFVWKGLQEKARELGMET